MLTVQLSYAGKVIGIFNILSRETGAFSPRFFSLFKAIADQVAVAVANILANEEILEREREKATLLSISEQLATIRDKHDLFTVIFEQLRPVFNFDDAVVVLYDAQSASTRHFTHIHSAAIDRTTAPTYQRIMTDKIPLAGTPYQEMLQLEEPRIVQMEYLLQHYQDHIGVQAAKAFGLTQHVFMPLRYCGQLLGFLEFHAKAKDRFNPHQLPLFRNVADQVAVAVANILANEEILQQKAEIEAREREKSLQVALINALTEPGNWEAKLLKAALVLQAHLPFDYLVIGLEEPDQAGRAYSFYRTGQREYQTIGREDFFRLTSLTPEKYAKLRQGKHYGQALVHNGADFESHCRQNGLQKIIAETFRLQSNLLFPLSLTRAGTFVLSFFSRQPQSYQAPHLALLEKLESTLSLTLDRLLAYEEIEGLSRQLRLDNRYLSEEIKSQYNFEEMVGGSRSMGQVFENLSLVAPTDTTVLILGETGTGKELIARALHNLSPRKGRPLIKVNCAALPANLIESELFGHEKGAFTGAIEQRIGKFELAQKGTIFLDEVGELPLELQSKLLRVLQEKEIERLGGKKTLSVDVRILAATNRKLEVEVKEGRFRADLYYRLNVFPLQLPPLRERREDIPLLAVHFAEKYARKMGKPLGNLSNASMQQMLAYNWPGNIRELEFLVERATILSRNGVLEIEVPVAPSAVAPTKVTLEDLRFKSLQESERDYIIEALKKTRGQVRGTGGAAELLQINPSTLVARIAKLGIKPKEVASGRSSY
jgi:transcriptional regulator with GAF, ATPase, and Fis domain